MTAQVAFGVGLDSHEHRKGAELGAQPRFPGTLCTRSCSSAPWVAGAFTFLNPISSLLDNRD